MQTDDEGLNAAELELRLAEAFGHRPPDWAVTCLGDRWVPTDDERELAALDARIAESLADFMPDGVVEAAQESAGEVMADELELARLDRLLAETFRVPLSPYAAQVLEAAGEPVIA